MKNKVLLVGGYKLPQGNASTVRAIGNARLLSCLGYDPIIVGKMTEKNDQHWCEYEGINCFDIECSNDRYGYGIGFLSILERTIPASEIYAIIAYNFPAKALELLRKHCKKNGIAMVSDATEWYAFEVVNYHILSAIRRKIQTEYRMRVINKRIGNIICSTNYIANYYSGCNTVIIPMIDDQSFTEEKRTYSDTIGRVKRFIYAGSPGHKFRKDKIDVIIKLFSRLKEEGFPFRLDIFGISEEQYASAFEYEFVGDEEHVIMFHGRVPRNEIERALEETDYCVLYRPNNKVCKVGFSTKCMEAMAHGVPMIANDINGDFRRYFTKGQALLCEPDDETAYYELLKQSIMLPDEEVALMKKSCIENNPFDYKCYIDPVGRFMKGIGNVGK